MKIKYVAVLTVFLLIFSVGLTAYADPVPDPNTPTGTETTTSTAATNPFTPNGTGTVTNAASGADGKEFYTITTPDKNVFYLVIDRQKGAENVYFLNAVTAADLLPLAKQPVTAATATPAPASTSTPSPTPAPAPQQNGGGNMGTYIFIAVFAVAGGGAGWYFKIYRPKKQGGKSEEYEPPVDEEEPDIPEDWYEQGPEDIDAPPEDGDESGAEE